MKNSRQKPYLSHRDENNKYATRTPILFSLVSNDRKLLHTMEVLTALQLRIKIDDKLRFDIVQV